MIFLHLLKLHQQPQLGLQALYRIEQKQLVLRDAVVHREKSLRQARLPRLLRLLRLARRLARLLRLARPARLGWLSR